MSSLFDRAKLTDQAVGCIASDWCVGEDVIRAAADAATRKALETVKALLENEGHQWAVDCLWPAPPPEPACMGVVKLGVFFCSPNVTWHDGLCVGGSETMP